MHSKDIHNHLQQRIAGMNFKECNHKPQGLPVAKLLFALAVIGIIACVVGW